MPAMSDAPLRGYKGRHEWFWEPGDEEHIFPLENLMDMYYKSVGRNSTLIMGLTPDRSGLLPEPDVKRIKEWGDEIKRRFETSVASVSGKGNVHTINLKGRQPVNHVIIQENIKNGERIRKYKVEGRVNGRWVTLCEGESVGHKRIEQFGDITVIQLRLTIEKSIAEPDIKLFSVFYVEPL